MAAINEAWRVLGDRALRAEYDRIFVDDRPLRTEPAPAPDPPAPPPPGPVEESNQPVTHSALWTRRWAMGVGILTVMAIGFFALLIWIAMGGFD